MIQLQDFISKCIHHHTLSNMLFDGIFEAHRAQILSCSNLGMDVWLITWLIFPTFWLSSLVFSTTFRTWLGLPHPSTLCIPQCVCTHAINLMDIHLLCCAHGIELTGAHDVIHDTFAAIVQDANFHVGQEQLHLFFSIWHDIQFLLLTNWHCVHQRGHLHLNQHCHCQPNASGFISLILWNSNFCCLWCSSSQGKKLLQLTPHWSILPFNNWGIWLLTQTC